MHWLYDFLLGGADLSMGILRGGLDDASFPMKRPDMERECYVLDGRLRISLSDHNNNGILPVGKPVVVVASVLAQDDSTRG